MGIWTETITGGSWATIYEVSQAGTAITQIGWRMPMRFRTEGNLSTSSPTDPIGGREKRVVAKSKGVGYIISRPDNAFPRELLAELGDPPRTCQYDG